jgi:hypothetical protein
MNSFTPVQNLLTSSEDTIRFCFKEAELLKRIEPACRQAGSRPLLVQDWFKTLTGFRAVEEN